MRACRACRPQILSVVFDPIATETPTSTQNLPCFNRERSQNVFELSRILQELAQAGYPLEPEAIAALSPYWTHHVNRFGVYDLNLDRCPPTIDFEAPILPTATS